MHAFVDRLPLMADEVEDHPLGCFIEGVNGFLGREPFVQRGECHVSEEFAWLMSPALHAVDRLVAARSAQALSPAPIAIMRNMPALRYWMSDEPSKYKSSLARNVPRWRELNDLLYWSSVGETRARLASKDQPLVDDWQITFVGHFWGFGPEDFERCLGWVRNKENEDDRLVALSRCIQLFIEADRPAAWLAALLAAIQGEASLKMALETRLEPSPSPALQRMEAQDRSWEAGTRGPRAGGGRAARRLGACPQRKPRLGKSPGRTVAG